MFSIDIEITKDLFELPYNHIHHGDMLRLLERCRAEYIKEVGFPLEWFLSQRLYLVISGITVEYKREVVEGVYTITAENARVNGRVASLHQRIINHKGKDATVADVDIMLLSRDKGRAIPLHGDFVDAFLNGPAAS